MHRIIEQAVADALWHLRDAKPLSCHKRGDRPNEKSITLAPKERKTLIRRMKRERKPSRRLRMHIVVLVADGYSPTRIARVLFCSRTTFFTQSSSVSCEKGEHPFSIARSEVRGRFLG